MTPTFEAYGGQRLHEGPGFSTTNYSDQDIAGTLGRLLSFPEFIPGFLRHHRLDPAAVVRALDAANPHVRDGAASVRLAVEMYPQLLQAWFYANPLPEVAA